MLLELLTKVIVQQALVVLLVVWWSDLAMGQLFGEKEAELGGVKGRKLASLFHDIPDAPGVEN